MNDHKELTVRNMISLAMKTTAKTIETDDGSCMYFTDAEYYNFVDLLTGWIGTEFPDEKAKKEI